MRTGTCNKVHGRRAAHFSRNRAEVFCVKKPDVVSATIPTALTCSLIEQNPAAHNYDHYLLYRTNVAVVAWRSCVERQYWYARLAHCHTNATLSNLCVNFKMHVFDCTTPEVKCLGTSRIHHAFSSAFGKHLGATLSVSFQLRFTALSTELHNTRR